MKKIFTLLAATMITLVSFAAKRPMVTIKANKNYEIVIDGKSYYSTNGNTISIPNLQDGRHHVRVFEVQRSLFRSSKKLVSSSNFRLRNKDVAITVDRFGQLRILESKSGRDYDRNDDWGRGRNNDDRGGRDGRGNRF